MELSPTPSSEGGGGGGERKSYCLCFGRIR